MQIGILLITTSSWCLQKMCSKSQIYFPRIITCMPKPPWDTDLISGYKLLVLQQIFHNKTTTQVRKSVHINETWAWPLQIVEAGHTFYEWTEILLAHSHVPEQAAQNQPRRPDPVFHEVRSHLVCLHWLTAVWTRQFVRPSPPSIASGIQSSVLERTPDIAGYKNDGSLQCVENLFLTLEQFFGVCFISTSTVVVSGWPSKPVVQCISTSSQWTRRLARLSLEVVSRIHVRLTQRSRKPRPMQMWRSGLLRVWAAWCVAEWPHTPCSEESTGAMEVWVRMGWEVILECFSVIFLLWQPKWLDVLESACSKNGHSGIAPGQILNGCTPITGVFHSTSDVRDHNKTLRETRCSMPNGGLKIVIVTIVFASYGQCTFTVVW